MIKNKGGRPTKYIPELIAKIDEYFEEAIPDNMRIPTVEGLCLKLDITRETAYQWGKEHKEFSDTLELIKVKQKEYLTEVGIFGGKEINANIVALFLKANHGMIETSHQDITTAGKPLPQPIIDVRSNNSDTQTSETEKKD
jgi:DNA-packaging protein gp3